MELQSARKPRGPSFSVGEFCRIKEGGEIFECIIKKIANNQAALEKVGYKKEVTVAVSLLLPSSGSKAREKQEKDANLSNSKTDWKIGDFCRAQWKEDSVIYEGQITFVGQTEGYDYAFITFLGYGNADSAFFHDILPSLGPESRKRQEIEAKEEEKLEQNQIGMDDVDKAAVVKKLDFDVVGNEAKMIDARRNGKTEDIVEYPVTGTIQKSASPAPSKWKLKARCRAVLSGDGKEYEATVMAFGDNGRVQIHFIGMDKDQDMLLADLKSSHGEEARKDQRNKFQLLKSSPKKKEWEVGMPCRALYAEDGQEYEGKILSIDSTEDGDKYTLVQFIGYGNEESIWLDDLLPSAGPEAAQRQIQEMLGEGATDANNNDQEVETTVETPIVDDATSAQLAPSASTEQKAIDWKVGMFCRAIFSEDGLEYEGELKEINVSDGHQYAIVEFLGYGNQETVWTDQLMESAGAKARKAQIDEALAGESEVAPAEKEEDVVVEKIEKTEVLAPKVQVAITETKVKTPGVVEQPKTDVTAFQTAPVTSTGQKVIDWKVGMFCRAIFSEDGLEYEGEIKEMNFADEHKYAIVEFLGYGNQEPVWTDQLMDSAGAKARKAQIDEALAGASEDAPVEKMEETVALAPKEPVIITETNVKTPVAVEKPKTVNEEPVIKEPAVVPQSKVELEPPMVNGVGRHQSNSGSDVAGTGSDKNNNVRRSYANLNTIPEAVSALSKEVDAINTIKRLTLQLELKDQAVNDLREKLYVTEAIVREVRDSNLQLKDENDRLRRSEYIVNTNMIQLMADVKILLEKGK